MTPKKDRTGRTGAVPGVIFSTFLLLLGLALGSALTGCGPEPGNKDQTGSDIFLIFERLKPVLEKDLQVPPEAITMGANLKKDLGAEEFELDTICLELNNIFDADLSLEDFRKLGTVGEMVDYIRIHKKPVAKKVEGAPNL
ncbi:MAG: acyl carrier protein [Cyanobacteria bacterium HKST-UBA02]|nr:acyl carrier protein [Cyanobacteria bacterium HKST-UBA02]